MQARITRPTVLTLRPPGAGDFRPAAVEAGQVVERRAADGYYVTDGRTTWGGLTANEVRATLDRRGVPAGPAAPDPAARLDPLLEWFGLTRRG